ncbi:hypothetical protein C8J56DRAFT_898579 [Mycena floridula]|nr:hypothetical protein C8J56DRAFT_898579 [Mycena floridula]
MSWCSCSCLLFLHWVSELTSSLQFKVKANLGPDLSLRLISGGHSAMRLELIFKWKYCNQLKLANCIHVLSMIEHDNHPCDLPDEVYIINCIIPPSGGPHFHLGK